MTALPPHLADSVGTLQLPTPEGVPLAFGVATASDRAAAFLFDLALVALLVVLLFFLAVASLGSGPGFATAFFLVATFLVRVFYFAWFEVRAQGCTPGKRRLRLRVVAADGGPLSVEAVLARNLLRELEFFLPLMFLLAPDQFWPGQPGWARLLGSAWILLLVLFPLCNRGRLRLGDLIAGTRVVVMPHAALLHDLSVRRGRPDDPGGATALQFTPAQLAVYGIYELQVLEEVLRKASLPGGREAVLQVCKRIQERIAFVDGEPKTPPLKFLEAFYGAQRRHLEQQLLYGKRKERKDQR